MAAPAGAVGVIDPIVPCGAPPVPNPTSKVPSGVAEPCCETASDQVLGAVVLCVQLSSRFCGVPCASITGNSVVADVAVLEGVAGKLAAIVALLVATGA